MYCFILSFINSNLMDFISKRFLNLWLIKQRDKRRKIKFGIKPLSFGTIRIWTIKKIVRLFTVVCCKIFRDIYPKEREREILFYSFLPTIPTLRHTGYTVNTLQGCGFTDYSFARIRHLSSHNCLEFLKKGLHFSTRYFIRYSRSRLVNIIAIRNVDVDDVTSAGIVVVVVGVENDGMAEEKWWKEETTLRSPFPFRRRKRQFASPPLRENHLEVS